MTCDTCVWYVVDAHWRDLLTAAQQCVFSLSDRDRLLAQLEALWTTKHNPNPVFPCLSARTALDLFLTIQNFPPDSEVIVSAINIPAMIYVLHEHQLKVVSLDVDLETLAPKIELLDGLLTEKTVALLVAHLFGKIFNMEPFVAAAKKHKLVLIEDCAESFCGFDKIGHPESDISLFSFGPIKFHSAFGGGIAKVKDMCVYNRMKRLHLTYPTQSHIEYFKKVAKYSLVYLCIDCPRFMKPSLFVLRALGIELRNNIVTLLRGFPNQMMFRMRHQPSTALLYMMYRRMSCVTTYDGFLSSIKAEYVNERMPKNVMLVGAQADVKGYWLFPILVVSLFQMVIYFIFESESNPQWKCVKP